MKTLVVLLFATVLFNCGGTDSTDDGADSADVTADDADVTEDGAGGDAEDPEFTDEADVGEDIATCPVGCGCCADYDCACFKWPQTVEYMWLVRQWKRISVDGKPADKIVDVTIEAWDDAIGAEAHTFSPYGPPYPYLHFKKNAETGQFEAINPETKKVVGYGDPVLLKIEYDSTIEVGVTHHSVWNALD